MITVAIKKYQTSKVGNGTVNVKGKKTVTETATTTKGKTTKGKKGKKSATASQNL